MFGDRPIFALLINSLLQCAKYYNYHHKILPREHIFGHFNPFFSSPKICFSKIYLIFFLCCMSTPLEGDLYAFTNKAVINVMLHASM
jgi:hypothetical protein